MEINLASDEKYQDPNDAYTEIYLNLKIHELDNKINRYALLIKKGNSMDNSEVKEYLTEIEVLRREKEKLTSYIYNKKASN